MVCNKENIKDIAEEKREQQIAADTRLRGVWENWWIIQAEVSSDSSISRNRNRIKEMVIYTT